MLQVSPKKLVNVFLASIEITFGTLLFGKPGNIQIDKRFLTKVK